MKRRLAILIACICLAGFGPAAAVQTKKTATHKKTAVHGKKVAGKRTSTAVRKTGTRRRTTASARSRRKRAPRRNVQLQPTPERYQQIQEALAAKGYSGGTPDGTWGPDWMDALKRFQKDQKLEPSGKLNSLSLIALGLGPDRDRAGTAVVPVASPDTPSNPPSDRPTGQSTKELP